MEKENKYPPVQVGDYLYTIYCYGIGDWRVRKSIVAKIIINLHSPTEVYQQYEGDPYLYMVNIDHFGESIFRDERVALQRMKELGLTNDCLCST